MKKLAYLLLILLIVAAALGISACRDTEEPAEYTVSYYDGDAYLGSRTVKEGDEIPDLTVSKQGNRLAGWFLKDGSSISGVTVKSDVSVYARWAKLYNLVLNYGKGLPLETIEAVAGESVTLPDTTGSIGGEKIVHWTDGLSAYQPGDAYVMPALDAALNAVWAQAVQITYVYNGQELTVDVAKGSTLKLKDDALSTQGNPVYSWKDASNVVYLAGEEITATESLRLVAMWAGSYTVTFDADGGEDVASVTKQSGEQIILPLPVRSGCTFLGWQIGDAVCPAGATFTMGAENVTAKALWDNVTFQVTLTDWDGYPFEVLNVGYGEDVVFPSVAITSLAEFVGWSSNGKNIMENTTITAQYNYQTPSNAALYTFTAVDGGYAVAAGNAELLVGTELVLPASYRGQKVVAVLDSTSGSSFKGFEAVTKITLTSPYQKLGNKAFTSLSNLTTVELNSGLKSIGNDCFMNCYKLTDLELNEGLTSIGSRAFYDIGVRDYYIPASVTSIADRVFFYYPSEQFESDNYYKSITVAQGSNTFASLDGVLYNKDFTTLVCYPANKDGNSFTLPSTVTTLGTYCFSYATKIDNFSFGDSRVTAIESLAFNSTHFDIVLPSSISTITQGMLNLAYGNVTLSSSIKVIGSFAFQSYYGKNVYIPATVETLEEYAFYHCPGVENVEFADGCRVEIIPAYAFEDCPKLKTVRLHEGLKEIGAYAFSVEQIGVNQNQLLSITFPASLERIGEFAFSFCGVLESVSFANGSWITEIAMGAFGSCYKLKSVSFGNNNKNVELTFGIRAFALSDELVDFNFPANLVSIGDECFAGAESKTYGYDSNKIKDIVLPASVRVIGNGAFSVSTLLETFTVESGSALETIGSQVFFNCFKLKSVVLPPSLRRMGSNVFSGCDELEDIQILSTTMNYEYVDGGLYNKESNTLEFARVGADGVFTVREGTVTIADRCFQKVDELTAVNIASTVKTIGNRVFYMCSSLEEVNIPSNSQLESIGEYAFAGSPDYKILIPFTEIYLPSTLKSIGSSAFMSTAISTPLTFSAELTTLEGYAFAYCPNLTSVTFAANSKLTSIGASAFYKCESLTTVIFGEGSALDSIGAIAFSGCTNLKTVVLTSQRVVTLGNNVFGNSMANLSIYVPDSLLTSYINGTGWSNYASCLKSMSKYNEN